MTEDMTKVVDYPKIHSPFVRKTINGRYVVTPQIAEGFEWVFEDPGVHAVDKLDGSGHCVVIRDGVVEAIDNRSTRIVSSPSISANMKKGVSRAVQGVLNAIERGWLKGKEGRIYGELIGPVIQTNIHMVHHPLFVPFDYLLERCYWKTWVANTYPKDFTNISNWFRDLPSLFTKKIAKKDALAEGLIFYHPDGRRAKLRRDMFDWFEES